VHRAKAISLIYTVRPDNARAKWSNRVGSRRSVSNHFPFADNPPENRQIAEPLNGHLPRSCIIPRVLWCVSPLINGSLPEIAQRYLARKRRDAARWHNEKAIYETSRVGIRKHKYLSRCRNGCFLRKARRDRGKEERAGSHLAYTSYLVVNNALYHLLSLGKGGSSLIMFASVSKWSASRRRERERAREREREREGGREGGREGEE